MSRWGLSGFDGAEPDFAFGSVAGARWWNLQLRGGIPELGGVHGPWTLGENIAKCRASRDHQVPDDDCGCGLWAYWQVPDALNPHGFGRPVLGVIEGYGRTLIGAKGFRCEKARIAALHFPDGAALNDADNDAPSFLRGRGDAVNTWRALTGRRGARVDPEDAVATLAAMEFLLEERYGAPVYGTRGLMLEEHPLTPDYLPPGARRKPSPPKPVSVEDALLRMLEKAKPPG